MATQEQIAKWASEVIPREKAALDHRGDRQ